MNSRKVKEIIKFSFYKNIQNKWFIIFNIITLISIIFALNFGAISSVFKGTSEDKVFEITLLDEFNLVYDEFYNEFSGDERYNITRIYENNYSKDNIPNNFAVIEIIQDEKEIFKTSIISKEGINVKIYNPIVEKLFEIRNDYLASNYDLTDENLKVLQSDLDVNRVMLSVNSEDSNLKEIIKLFSSAFTYLLITFIFSKMSNEIVSEKQSKSTEYILTTVSAKEYLFAKIFSNITILVIQGLLLFVYYFIAVSIMNIINITGTDISLSASVLTGGLSMNIVLYILALIVYNVLNLILLCIIQATISARTSSTSEAGNTVSLMLFIMMLAYVGTIFLITPETKVSLLLYIVSCIPILSAYFVPGMMIIGQATWLQIIVSLLLLIVSIPIVFNLCSNIFKNGILNYTKLKAKKEMNKEEARSKFLVKREMKNLGFVIGMSIIIYIGTQAILSLFGNLVLTTLFGNILGETDILLVLQIILQIISLGLASVFVFSYTNKGKEEKRKISFKTQIKIIFVSIVMIFGLQFLLTMLIYPVIGLDYSTTDIFNINSESSIMSKLIAILAIAVVPAIFEELFFRKAVIDLTLKHGKKFALLFSAVLFGLLHMNLAQGLFAFIGGIIFGSIYLYTRNIKFTMLIHFINNGFGVLELILAELGALIIVGILLICLVIGTVLVIITLVEKESRAKVIKLCKIPVYLKSFEDKYMYIFTDYTFDISMILVGLMSILTENILR